jgi:uncharacterized protein (TIGR03083 family)
LRTATPAFGARVDGLARGLADPSMPVPTCPGWTVHDVLAHLSGVVADVLAGNFAGIATEPWTLAQVEARRDASVEELLAEWELGAPAFVELIDLVREP